MFPGTEALDEEGLAAFRKRTTPKVNNKALEVARSMGLSVAINIIADPDLDEARRLTTLDHRLFDVQVRQARYPCHGHLLPRQAKRRTATSPASTPASAAEPDRC